MTVLRLILNPIVFIALSGAIQIYAGYQEIFAWPAFGDDVVNFGVLIADAPQQKEILDAAGLLALNQGFYNWVLAAGLFAAILPIFQSEHRRALAIFSLLYMAAVGFFGLATVPEPGGTATPNIVTFSAQAIPPTLGLIGMALRGWRVA